MTVVADILRKARALLSDPDRWTEGGLRPGYGSIPFSSVTVEGVGCHYADAKAHRFCALDAVFCVGTIGANAPEPREVSFADHPATTAAAGYLLHEAYVLGHNGWTGLNEMGHVAVLAAYDRAIERERAGRPPVPLKNCPLREDWLATEEHR